MVSQEPCPEPDTISNRLWELVALFAKLGGLGFGGPQAHIAMMNYEVVILRQWMTQEQFTEGLAMCEMLPGPASTQMGIYTGYVCGGQLGALASGLSFITPAFLIVIFLSWVYFKYQEIPQLDAIFLGVSPVVCAIILAFCWKLAHKTINNWLEIIIALMVFILVASGSINIILLFLISGLIGLLCFSSRNSNNNPSQTHGLYFLPGSFILSITPTKTLTLSSFWGLERIAKYFFPLAIFFLKTGSFIFGGGLVIIPLLEFEVVQQFNWMTQSEFINGVAIGQLSPGPVVLASAFVGYKVAGFLGALVSAIAIFVPSFAFIMLASPLMIRLQKSSQAKAFLKGVTPAVLGAIVAASFPLIQSSVLQETFASSLISLGIGIAALIALVGFKVPTWKLVPAGGFLGLLIGWIL